MPNELSKPMWAILEEAGGSCTKCCGESSVVRSCVTCNGLKVLIDLYGRIVSGVY